MGERHMRLQRVATFWRCEAEVEREGNHVLYVWEKLITDAPIDARPYCCYLNTVIFYQRDAWQEITRTESYDLNGMSPHLLEIDGHWWEVIGGHVLPRNGSWWKRWRCQDNTREARRANLGYVAELANHISNIGTPNASQSSVHNESAPEGTA